MDLRYRIGTFFTVIGLGLLVLFVLSVMTKETTGIFLLASIAALFFAFLLNRNKPRPESTRFAAVKKARERSRQRREEKIKKQAEKKKKK